MAACARWSIGGIARIGCLAIVIASASPAASQVVNGPKQYYLALGDSIAYGYQASKHEAGLPPSAFDTGYVDVFAARLREIQPGTHRKASPHRAMDAQRSRDAGKQSDHRRPRRLLEAFYTDLYGKAEIRRGVDGVHL
jgi:hypothetical protein